MTKENRNPNDGEASNRSGFGLRVSLLIRHTFPLSGIIRVCPSFFCLACGLVIVGCTTEKKQKWLNFFFDGVPQRGGGTNAPAIVYDENGRPLDRTVAPQTNTNAPIKVKFTAHPPYE